MASAESNPWIYDQNARDYYYYNASEKCFIYHSGRKVYPPSENVITGASYQGETTPRQAGNEQSVPFVPPTHSRESSGGSNQYQVAGESLAGLSLEDEIGIGNEQIEKTDTASQESIEGEEVGAQFPLEQAEHQALPTHQNTSQTYSYPINRTYPATANYSYPQTSNQPTTAPLVRTVPYFQGSEFSGQRTHLPPASVEHTNYLTHPSLSSLYTQTAYEIVEAGKIPVKRVDAGRVGQSTQPGNSRERKRLGGPPESAQVLDPGFEIRRPGYEFFKTGKVFKVVWPELAGDSETVVTTMEWRKEKIFVKVRWFIVIREGHDCCSCLPIQTHGGRGASNKVKSHHAIIYTGSEVPKPLDAEIADYTDRLLRPIQVEPKHKYDKLDPISRVNFYKIYNVEHNVKVYDFGQVHKNSEFWLLQQFKSAWGINTTSTNALPSSAKPRSQGPRSRRSSRSTNNPMPSNASEITQPPGTDSRPGYINPRGLESRTTPQYVSASEYQRKQQSTFSYIMTPTEHNSRTLDAHEPVPRSRSQSRSRLPGALSSVQQDTIQTREPAVPTNPLDPYGYRGAPTASKLSHPSRHDLNPTMQDEREEEEEELDEEPVGETSRQPAGSSRRRSEAATQGTERTRPKSGRSHSDVKRKGERRQSIFGYKK